MVVFRSDQRLCYRLGSLCTLNFSPRTTIDIAFQLQPALSRKREDGQLHYTFSAIVWTLLVVQ